MTIKMQNEIVSNEHNNKGGNSNFLSTYDNLSFLFTHMFYSHQHLYLGTYLCYTILKERIKNNKKST
jgi:hypothetical protein